MKKISSSGAIRDKIFVAVLAIVLGFVMLNEAGLSLLITLPCYLFVFSYLFVLLFYNPNVAYNDSSISFKRFNKNSENIPFTKLIAIDANPQAYHEGGSIGSRNHYKIWYTDNYGKRKKVDFYIRKAKLQDFQEMVRLIKSSNKSFGNERILFTIK